MGQPGQYRLPRPRVPAGWRNSRLIKYLGLILASFLFFTVLHSARDLIGDISSGAGSAIGTDGSGWGWPGFGNGLWKPTLGGVLSDDQFADLKKQLDAKTSRTDETVKKLEKLLPGAIFARKDKAGNVIISPDFWDALKARFKHDGSILILDDKARLTDKHWKAIQERLGTDKTITAISEEWEDWKKRNEEHVNDHVKHPEKGHAGDAVISRSFVIDKIQTALAKNKKEIAKEMDTLRKELHGVIRGIQSEMGRGTTAGHPAAGLSRDEATSLIKKIVSQQITERQLQLASKSGKTSTLDAQLQMHQPNQFAPGNGALVDITLTSPTWAAPKERMNTNRWAKKPRPLYSFQPIDALSPWGGEPGHCWCAAVRSRNGDHVPADLSVRLPGFIVPRHLALEHINPDLTVDADATPKNIEVWAVYDHPDRRSSVINTFLRKFPNQDRNLVRQGLLQIGSFEYKYKAEDDGVFIYSFPSEIHSMSGAATDQVLIRAVTNVGGVDHTCIYRLRLYGSPREGLERTNIRRFDDWERGVVE
ncbi:hypothetical protein QBC42DRAFT_166273 [Cladorrhinum samala]|uniref:SUN domain-containing protein n=1 Tax=Cladorrhinum samala TaxID=585594 RepID=A0AAV9I3Y7_9PEZI|nr:hypothetical protein QBC42DRAFT_166273 [Cladorrhinum samala]